MTRITLFAIGIMSLASLCACEPPPPTAREKKEEAARSVQMARLRLELWEEVSLRRLRIGPDGAVGGIEALRTWTTEPIAFEVWLGGGPDAKTFAELPDGRRAFFRFEDLLVRSKKIEAAGWGFDTNFAFETAEPPGRTTKVNAGAYFQSTPVEVELGQSVERRLSGFTDSTKDPSITYTPVARLTLVELAPYGNRTKKDAKLLVTLKEKDAMLAERARLANEPDSATTAPAPTTVPTAFEIR